MKIVDSRTGIEALGHEECVELLRGDVIGRLAVVDGRTPVVLPVNYAMDGEAVVFRTAPGLKLEVGHRAPASFEIDQFDREHHGGWSVVVSGHLEEVDAYDSETLERVRALGVTSWAAGERSHWMRLVPSRITGRRIGTGE